MRQDWKRTPLLFVGCMLAIGLIANQAASPAVAEDTRFVPAVDVNGDPFEAVHDTATKLVWGKDLGIAGSWYADGHVSEWAHGVDGEDPDPNQTGRYGSYSEENPGGWRLPTMTEVLDALDREKHTSGQSLVDVLDFSYEPDKQSWDSDVPAGHPYSDPEAGVTQWGDVYFWTVCRYTQGGRYYLYEIRYRDGDYRLDYGGSPIIPVRYAGGDASTYDPSHDRCPKNHRGTIPDIPGKSKPPKPPKK